eukprot:2925036-Rhodomonas_salina.1
MLPSGYPPCRGVDDCMYLCLFSGHAKVKFCHGPSPKPVSFAPGFMHSLPTRLVTFKYVIPVRHACNLIKASTSSEEWPLTLNLCVGQVSDQGELVGDCKSTACTCRKYGALVCSRPTLPT